MRNKWLLILSTALFFSSSSLVDAAEQHENEGYKLNVQAYSSKIGESESWQENDIGLSTVVLSGASKYDVPCKCGYVRARVWSRPSYVYEYMKENSSSGTAIEIRAKLTLVDQSGGNFWIDGSEPVDSQSKVINLTSYSYYLADAIFLSKSAYSIAAQAVLSVIDGFEYASIKTEYPLNTKGKHRVTFYNYNGLPNMALNSDYGYKEADYRSQNNQKAASARWKFGLDSRINTPITVAGQVQYKMNHMNYSTGYGYTTYAWSGTAESAPIYIEGNG